MDVLRRRLEIAREAGYAHEVWRIELEIARREQEREESGMDPLEARRQRLYREADRLEEALGDLEDRLLPGCPPEKREALERRHRQLTEDLESVEATLREEGEHDG